MNEYEKKQHIADNFIQRTTPYLKPESLGFDMREYACYVKKHDLKAQDISETDMSRFVVKDKFTRYQK